VNITLTEDQKESVTRMMLVDLIENFDGTYPHNEVDDAIVLQLHRLVAWHSVPGTYMEGKYDV
jgi:hypothetical protein